MRIIKYLWSSFCNAKRGCNKTLRKLTLASLLGMSIFSTSLFAAETDPTFGNIEIYLRNIQAYTYKILTIVNDFPVYLSNVSLLAMNWMKPDDTAATTQMQGNFSTLGNLIINNINAQNDRELQLQLTASLLGLSDTTSFTTPPDNPRILKTLANINDLTYTTLLGLPPVTKNAPGNGPYRSAPYSYILNAGGLNIHHPSLPPNPPGNRADVEAYRTYYNTVMAIQSFNGYVIGGHFAEAKNGEALNAAQMSLVQQASQSNWFTQIASEELGKVLRQILMFQSQTYILLTQLIQTQKQLLVAQTMTNSILILNNQANESVLYSKALGLSY